MEPAVPLKNDARATPGKSSLEFERSPLTSFSISSLGFFLSAFYTNFLLLSYKKNCFRLPSLCWNFWMWMKAATESVYPRYACAAPTNIPTYLPTYLPTYYQHTYLPTYLPTNIPTYQHTNIPTYLPIYPPTNIPTHLT